MIELLLTVLLQTVTPECPEGYAHRMPYCVAAAPEPQAPAVFTRAGGVERWRPWIVIYFKPADVEFALRVMRCESLGDPYAVGGVGEVGLFQHHPRYWAERSARFGWGGWSAYSVDANVAVAAALVYAEGWRHWTCAR